MFSVKGRDTVKVFHSIILSLIFTLLSLPLLYSQEKKEEAPPKSPPQRSIEELTKEFASPTANFLLLAGELVSSQDKRAPEEIKRILAADERPKAVVALLDAISFHKYLAGTKEILLLTCDYDREEVRKKALETLEKLQGAELNQRLIEIMEDPGAGDEARREAVRILGELSVIEAIPKLIRLLPLGIGSSHNSDDLVLWALEEISGEDFGKDGEAWEKWWNEVSKDKTLIKTSILKARLEKEKKKSQTFKSSLVRAQRDLIDLKARNFESLLEFSNDPLPEVRAYALEKLGDFFAKNSQENPLEEKRTKLPQALTRIKEILTNDGEKREVLGIAMDSFVMAVSVNKNSEKEVESAIKSLEHDIIRRMKSFLNNGKDRELKLKAVTSLGDLKKPDFIGDLVSLLRQLRQDKKDLELQRMIVSALGKIGNPGEDGITVAAIGEVMADNSDTSAKHVELRRQGAMALGNIKGQRSMEILQATLVGGQNEKKRDPSEEVRFFAADGLASLSEGDLKGQVVESLVAALADPSRIVRIECVTLLGGKLKAAEAVPALIEMLKASEEAALKKEIIKAFGNIGERTAVELLVEMVCQEPDGKGGGPEAIKNGLDVDAWNALKKIWGEDIGAALEWEEKLFQAGKYDRLLEVMKAAEGKLKEGDLLWGVKAAIARSSLARKNLAEAKTYFEQLKGKFPKQAIYHLGLADCLIQQGEVKAGIEVLKEGLNAETKNTALIWKLKCKQAGGYVILGDAPSLEAAERLLTEVKDPPEELKGEVERLLREIAEKKKKPEPSPEGKKEPVKEGEKKD